MKPRYSALAIWLRTLKVAYWLGWQIESNWTDPLLFFIYSIARPLGGALILVFMYFVVSRGRQAEMLGFFVVGTAFWPFVIAGMMGMAWGIISDREHWKTLRYVYTSPIPYWVYLVGRSLAQATSATAAMAITLLFGRWVLHVPLHVGSMNISYATIALALGITSIVALGFIVVSAAMGISGEAWRMPEGVGAALYLVCGAIFPVTVLPGALQNIAQTIPLTWWLEAMRRGLLGNNVTHSFPWAGDGQVLAIFAVVTAVWTGAAAFIFSYAERRARVLGVLDRESGF
ncbi:MAG: ABC transporter permease [Armatimonadetes bacterium]|nr:ABC transporter permease [Armatimonadota bacterium]